MRQRPGGDWVATVLEPNAEATGASSEECLANLRRELAAVGEGDGDVALTVEVVPVLAGVAEAAEVMGWDKRRVITYIQRGRFPEPIQALASGRVWLRSDVEDFAERWHARRRATGRRERA
jgi:predicted DNA-binding transcriptional regulator AlpA